MPSAEALRQLAATLREKKAEYELARDARVADVLLAAKGLRILQERVYGTR